MYILSVKTLNTLVKRTSPHSMVAKDMYKQISSVHGSSVLTVKHTQDIQITFYSRFFSSSSKYRTLKSVVSQSISGSVQFLQ